MEAIVTMHRRSRTRRIFAGCVLLPLVAGCAGRTAEPMPPAPATAEPTPEPELRTRYDVRPLVPSRAFQQAVLQGTRTGDGVPGANYWQNRVRYRIDAELNPASATVQGELVVRYANNSPDTLRSILMHVYQNAFGQGVQRVRRVPVTGGAEILRVAVDNANAPSAGTARDAEARPRYRLDGTLMWVDLARPLLPGGEVEVEVGWRYRVPPPGAPRTGHVANEAFVIAQWYPQVAVYDDLRGWHDTPYWTNGEFYLEYGDFDVSLTVPEQWLVTATGELENADEVLTPGVRAALRRAHAQDSIVSVVDEETLDQGIATVQEPGGALTWRFTADDVRDFAWATSNRYLWDATRARVPDANGDGAPETVLVHAFYRPQARNNAWGDAVRFMRHAIAFHSEQWGPYLYPHISAAEGPIGGMEYPMLVFIGGSRTPTSLYSVLSHEIAHMWWPMMVGSNESRYAWQDEGLVTYVKDLSLADYFAGEQPWLATQDAYLRIADTDAELPIMTAPDLFGIGPQYGVAAYTKPGTLLRALEVVIGDSLVHRSLREYTARWLFRHPSPWDFFNTVEAVAGRDLDWFWSPWFTSTAHLDQAVESVLTETRADGAVTVITVRDDGTAPMPVPLTVTFADGSTRELVLPVEPWLEGRVMQSVEVPGDGVVRVEIDAGRRMPDVERENNVWRRDQ